ncbi:uncharacterized protein LOC113330779 [Papaver somniferum]|uniref:uncharacterized protein LOC113330779 n=1 Tax=Papaver somniferum TaxID=3469 RepID=UPI000E701222|nr:uncharacterized protein LOC113330779 [Papaver somniferum]
MNEDFATMEKDAAKVANLTRKNAQDSKIHLFNDFCDSHGIPRVPLDHEIFSDDVPADEKKDSTDKDDDDEDTETDEDNDTENPKSKASLITKVADIPSSSSNLLGQYFNTVNVEAETVGASGGNHEHEIKESGGDAEEEAIKDVPIQQLPLQS